MVEDEAVGVTDGMGAGGAGCGCGVVRALGFLVEDGTRK